MQPLLTFCVRFYQELAAELFNLLSISAANANYIQKLYFSLVNYSVLFQNTSYDYNNFISVIQYKLRFHILLHTEHEKNKQLTLKTTSVRRVLVQ